ncbi:MAG: hypothetical protein LBR38_09460 [Synergistaceae bacterium]|nr:hypothetical protein [Synergistaceae bacterium]
MKKTVYILVVVLLALLVGQGYVLWLARYTAVHPEVVQATAMGYVEEMPMDGALIWDEAVVLAPREGVLTYPSLAPRRVAKGDVIAALDGVPVRAAYEAYFTPKLDGAEGIWVYAKIWAEHDRPPVRDSAPIGGGAGSSSLRVPVGAPLGKLVPQPQDLRLIAYLDSTASLLRDVKGGYVEIRTRDDGKVRRAEVRAFDPSEGKIKVYVTLPFFPPSMLNSREFSCVVMSGEKQGVAIPNSAVILRDGRLLTLMVQGNTAKLTEVEGFPADEEYFLATKGLPLGSMVVRYAAYAEEGAVILW